jgi:pimeloyl-ACP methyl ester carboxylesterase
MQQIKICGQNLEYTAIEGTSAQTPTLIFLHEGLGSAAMWRDFPAKLASATGAAALVYSRPGYGHSPPPPGPRGPDYMHVEALEILPELRRALHLDDVVLVGHSDGASIALIHAGAGRWPVRALVLEAPHVFVEKITVESIEKANEIFEATDLRDRLGRYHADPEAMFWTWNRAWLDPRFRDWNIEASLAGVRCPVLAIQGEEDEYGTLAQLDAIERGVAGRFERLVLAQCGHAPHRDREEATLAAMTRFTRSLAPGDLPWHSTDKAG